MWKASNLSRRKFLQMSSLGLAGLSCLSTRNPLFADEVDPGKKKMKALVIVELLGGLDNTLFSCPTDPTLYSTLSDRRGGLIIPTDFNLEAYNVPIALHPQLATLAPYVPNLRVTMNCANASHVNPSGSHEAQQLRMALGGVLEDTGTKGWVSRVYDNVPELELMGFLDTKDVNFNCKSSKCTAHPPRVFNTLESFNLAGSNFASAQGGSSNTNYVANVLERLSHVQPNREVSPSEEKYRTAFKNLFPVIADVQETISTYPTPEYDNYTTGSGSYNRFAQRMRNIASTLLRMKVEESDQPIIFVVGIGGFDVHGGWEDRCSGLMHTLGGVLRTFCDDLVAMDLFDDVVINTNTEFGRQIRGNGAGTDHGKGFPMLTLGGKVRGGQHTQHSPYGTILTLDQAQNHRSWPIEFDSRAIFADILEFHLGIDPYQSAYPGVIGTQFDRENFGLFA